MQSDICNTFSGYSSLPGRILGWYAGAEALPAAKELYLLRIFCLQTHIPTRHLVLSWLKICQSTSRSCHTYRKVVVMPPHMHEKANRSGKSCYFSGTSSLCELKALMLPWSSFKAYLDSQISGEVSTENWYRSIAKTVEFTHLSPAVPSISQPFLFHPHKRYCKSGTIPNQAPSFSVIGTEKISWLFLAYFPMMRW
jgi:hypothetical protein